jgi:catechol 2,3-dioxygenase-like lactoylglutathione lyase family enzyme
MAEFTQGATVFVPVTDQDRAIAFYTEVLGFEQVADFTYADGVRWAEVAPGGGIPRVALILGEAGIETRVAFGTTDIEAAHAALARYDAGPIIRDGDAVQHWGGVVLGGTPPMFVAHDPDGNSFLVVQA